MQSQDATGGVNRNNGTVKAEPQAGGQSTIDVETSSPNDTAPNQGRAATRGYASLSSFMASDKVFSVFRRFDEISIRTLLHLQDELCQLEESLQKLDQADTSDGSPFNL